MYARALAIADWVSGLRHRLHEVPERGFDTVQTSRVIAETLDELGIPCEIGEKNWVIGLIEGAGEGTCVGLRADIDALPVTEPQGCPFRSKREGFMHACGHDSHAAMLLGAARILQETRGDWRGKVKLLFQPAEETVGGAEPMVKAGALENPHVDYVYGLHVMPRLFTGQVETKAGTLNASTDDVTLTVIGRSGHGAYPEGGADAIVCAAQIVSACQAIVARNVSPLSSAVVHFGVVSGGVASNVICDKVVLRGTVRAADPQIRALVTNRLRETCEGTARAMGCEAELTVESGYCALVNDPKEAARVLRVAGDLFGADKAVVKDAPSMGGEDFAYFNNDTPGAFYHIGCTKPGEMPTALHSPEFTIDEACFPIGVAMHVSLALDAMKGAE